jgi:hypothetical protein
MEFKYKTVKQNKVSLSSLNIISNFKNYAKHKSTFFRFKHMWNQSETFFSFTTIIFNNISIHTLIWKLFCKFYVKELILDSINNLDSIFDNRKKTFKFNLMFQLSDTWALNLMNKKWKIQILKWKIVYQKLLWKPSNLKNTFIFKWLEKCDI